MGQLSLKLEPVYEAMLRIPYHYVAYRVSALLER